MTRDEAMSREIERRGGYRGGTKEGVHPWQRRSFKGPAVHTAPAGLSIGIAALKAAGLHAGMNYRPTYGVRYKDHLVDLHLTKH